MAFRIRTIDHDRRRAARSSASARSRRTPHHRPRRRERHPPARPGDRAAPCARDSERRAASCRSRRSARSASRIDGRSAATRPSSPREGAELELGSYRLEFSRRADGASRSPCVSAARPRKAAERSSERFSLASVLPGKRGMAWLALAAIVIAFLAVPICSHLDSRAAKPTIDRPGTVLMDASWSPGALSCASRARGELRGLPRQGVRRRAR